MAKRKRKEEAEWEPPDFDEVKFMKREMRAMRITVLVILWAIPAALVSYVLTVPPLGVSVVAFFAGIGMMFLLKWVLPLLRVETKEWKRRDWMGHGSTFFFTWLAVWILLLNPPFADLTPPMIFAITAGGQPVGCGQTVSVGGTSTNLNVSVGDNVGVAIVTVDFGTGPVPMDHVGGTLWNRTVPVGRDITIVAKDPSGNAATCGIRI